MADDEKNNPDNNSPTTGAEGNEIPQGSAPAGENPGSETPKSEASKSEGRNRVLFYKALFWTLLAPGAGLFCFGKYFRACFRIFLWGIFLDGLLFGLFVLDSTYGPTIAYTSFFALVFLYMISFWEIVGWLRKENGACATRNDSPEGAIGTRNG